MRRGFVAIIFYLRRARDSTASSSSSMAVTSSQRGWRWGAYGAIVPRLTSCVARRCVRISETWNRAWWWVLREVVGDMGSVVSRMCCFS